MGKRINWVDAIKAIAIIAVVYGHSVINPLADWFYNFHIPVFFVIAGFFLNTKASVLETFGRKFKTIMIPFYVFGLVYYPYWFFISSKFRQGADIEWWKPFVGLIYGGDAGQNWLVMDGPLWFLPVYFGAVIFSFLIFKYVVENENFGRFSFWFGLIIFLVVAFFGYYLKEQITYRLPFGFDIALNAIPFVFAGYVYIKKIDPLIPEHLNFTLMLVFLLLSVLAFPGVDLCTNSTGPSMGLYWGITLAGSFFLIFMAKSVNIGWLNYLGEKSLFIMGFHFPVLRMLKKLTHDFGGIDYETINSSIFWGIYSTIITIAICLLVEYIFYKWVWNKQGLLRFVKSKQ